MQEALDEFSAQLGLPSGQGSSEKISTHILGLTEG